MSAFDLLRTALLGPWGPKLLPQTLRLELLRLRFDGSFTWKAQKQLVEAAMRLSLRAYSGPEPAVLTSLFTPSELIHGLGMVPFGLESAGGMTASLDIAGHTLALADEGWLPSDACSILRSALGGARAGLLPRPVALACTTTLCDSTPKAFAEAARHLGGAPVFVLDVPYEGGDAAVEYLAGQLRSLASQLERLGGRLDPARLASAIRESNEARSYLVKINALRRQHPGLLSAADAAVFLYPTSLLLGSRDGTALYRAFYEELLAAARQRTPDDSAGLRVLWLHLLPYYPHHLLDHLTNAGATVVFEEMNEVYWEPLDPQQPFASLARKCINTLWNGPLSNRIAAIRRLASEHRIDGAVHFSHWGCRQSTGALPVVAAALQADGVPLLVLDGDCVDARSYSDGQYRTRLEGFVEMLESRRR
ncbi:MAG: 2-hydroxyacyl-CoA dehydratase family protein [Chloroflexi bacterium]|nr:2-hydroxyacyl-CoA dehydratase family protein [Chloroflexota bacterium]